MRAPLRVALLVALCSLLPAQAGASDDTNGSAELTSREDKIVYVLGLSMAQFLSDFELSEQELGVLISGLSDGTLGREPQVSPSIWARRIEGFKRQRVEQARARMDQVAAEFLAQAESQPGAERTASGLVYAELEPGSGEAPKKNDTVRVDYHGTRTDGSVFDSTRGKTPATFALDAVIPCWTEGLQKMRVGGKSTLVCPAEIAYGDRGVPGSIKPGAVLTFEVELLEIVN